MSYVHYKYMSFKIHISFSPHNSSGNVLNNKLLINTYLSIQNVFVFFFLQLYTRSLLKFKYVNFD